MGKYEASGLSTLGTPCGDFANQEPGGNDEILAGLKYVRPGNGFVPAFPLMQKVRTLRTAWAGGTEALRQREGGRRLPWLYGITTIFHPKPHSHRYHIIPF
jgi:hypothetical protein